MTERFGSPVFMWEFQLFFFEFGRKKKASLSNSGVPPLMTKLPHLSTTGPNPCQPFHLMSAVTALKAVDPKSAGILTPLPWVAGSFGSPAGIPAALEDLLSPTWTSTPSSCRFPFAFSPALVFHPLIGNFPCRPATRKIVSDLRLLSSYGNMLRAQSVTQAAGGGPVQSRLLMKIPWEQRRG